MGTIKMTTLLVTLTPVEGEGEAMSRYLQGVGPLLAGAGGTPVKRVRVTETITATAGIGLALVMDFENADAIKSVFDGDAYEALIPDRDKAFSNLEIVIAEPLG